MKGVPVVRGGVVGIDLERAAVLAFGDGPIEVMANSCKAERGVSLGGRGIEFDSLSCCLFGRAGRFRKRLDTEDADPVVIVGNAGVGERVIGIEFDRALVRIERLRKTG